MKFKSQCLFYIFSLFTSLHRTCSADTTLPAPPTYFQYYDNLEKDPLLNDHLIIHMMFFPWDKNQQYIDDEFNFDHSPYLNMVERVKSIPNAHVIMWTRSKTKDFCTKYYPAFWKILEKYSQRNVMFIDILRCLVVHHYGGVYWQYDSIPYALSMTNYLPAQDKKWRLFTESIIPPRFALMMAKFPIRQGKPEEAIRVATQVFSCNERKNAKIIDFTIFLLQRMITEKLTCDYDVLYITGNAAMSEYYDQYLKHDQTIELTSFEVSQKMINWNGKNRWKMDYLK